MVVSRWWVVFLLFFHFSGVIDRIILLGGEYGGLKSKFEPKNIFFFFFENEKVNLNPPPHHHDHYPIYHP